MSERFTVEETWVHVPPDGTFTRHLFYVWDHKLREIRYISENRQDMEDKCVPLNRAHPV